MTKRLESRIGRSIWGTALLGLVAGAGCTGMVSTGNGTPSAGPGSASAPGGTVTGPGGTGTGTGGAGSVGGGASGGPGGLVPASACVGQTGIPAALPARRLTRAEYNASVAVLLQDSTSPATNLPPEVIRNLFSNDSAQQPVSDDLDAGYNTVAADIATRATQATVLAALAPCAAAATTPSAQ